MCEYEVNQSTNEKVINGKRNFNATCKQRQTPGRLHTRTVSPIYKPKFSLKNLAKYIMSM